MLEASLGVLCHSLLCVPNLRTLKGYKEVQCLQVMGWWPSMCPIENVVLVVP